MTCKFTWYNLPNQIKKLIKPFENQLSKEAKNITRWNLPNKLNVLYNELSLIKISCKEQVNFIWFTLNEKAEAICELIDCITNINIIVSNADNYSILTSTTGVIGNILTNDTLNGLPTNASQVEITASASTLKFLTMDINGDISVNGNQIAGTYIAGYYICEISNPTNCSLPTSITIIVT